MKSYDAVVIGGGHNGLVVACYLARAGFDVCVLERYKRLGQGGATEEIDPEQACDFRPVPGSKTYKGPIRGLDLCGAGAWPGGCVMGAPGHNAAHEAIANLKAGRHN